MGRGLNYFFGMLFSRMSVVAYSIGSGITTAFLYLTGIASLGTRVFTDLPLVIEMYLRVAIPLWVPPITATDIVVLCLNLSAGLLVLLWWTAKYDHAMSRRGRSRW